MTFERTARTDPGGRKVDVQSHLVLEKSRVEPAELAEFARFQKEVRDEYAAWLSRAGAGRSCLLRIVTRGESTGWKT